MEGLCSYPRMIINLTKLEFNAKYICDSCKSCGIDVWGVTKATYGDPYVALAMISGGCVGICESRVHNIIKLRNATINAPLVMIRAPMECEIGAVVEYADVSFNSEVSTVKLLSEEAERQEKVLPIILCIETGERREGIVPENFVGMYEEIRALPNIVVKGVATCLGCMTGVLPTQDKMCEFYQLGESFKKFADEDLDTFSFGNSANLEFVLDEEKRALASLKETGESSLHPIGESASSTLNPDQGSNTPGATPVVLNPLHGKVVEQVLAGSSEHPLRNSQAAQPSDSEEEDQVIVLTDQSGRPLVPEGGSLRVGEAILNGNSTFSNGPIPELYQDAFIVEAQVIEAKFKTGMPDGHIGVSDAEPKDVWRDVRMRRVIVALGKLDCDFSDLKPSDTDLKILEGSSDHMVLEESVPGRSEPRYYPGSIVRFQVAYGAVARLCGNPTVQRVYEREQPGNLPDPEESTPDLNAAISDVNSDGQEVIDIAPNYDVETAADLASLEVVGASEVLETAISLPVGTEEVVTPDAGNSEEDLEEQAELNPVEARVRYTHATRQRAESLDTRLSNLAAAGVVFQ